jgi:RarD protein
VNRGTALTIIANLIWGFAALYWIETQPIGPVDLLAHRALWSVPVLVACLLWMGRLCGALAIFTRPGALGLMAASATTQAANWGIFLWAVTSGRATEASLGYFLLPLLNIAFGIYLFGEQIGRAQRIAISLAGLGMLILIAENRGLPWAALGVAVSFGLYGVIRKKVTVGAIEGLFVETLLMAPLALLWLMYRQDRGQRERKFWLGVLEPMTDLRGAILVQAIDGACSHIVYHPYRGEVRLDRTEIRRWMRSLRESGELKPRRRTHREPIPWQTRRPEAEVVGGTIWLPASDSDPTS